MPNKVLLLFIVLLLPFQLLFAQDNFLEGYIVTNSNDTLQGLIDYRGEVRMARLVRFTKSDPEVIEDYEPFQIEAYSVNDEIRRSLKVPTDQDSISAFVQVLAEGPINYYYFKDKSNNERHYLEKGTELLELISSATSFDGPKQDKYISILNYLMYDCDQFTRGKVYSRLNSGDLKKLVSKYNNCMGATTTLYETQLEKRKAKFQGSFRVGVHSANVKSGGPNAIFDEGGAVSGLSLGLNGKLFLPAANQSLAIDLGIAYNEKGTEAQDRDIVFDTKFLDFTAGLSYNYPKGDVRPIVEGVFVFGTLLNDPDSAFTAGQTSRALRIILGDSGRRPAFNEPNKLEVGFGLRAGIKIATYRSQGILLIAEYQSTYHAFGYASHNYRNSIFGIRAGYQF